jgi:hypothetical protein
MAGTITELPAHVGLKGGKRMSEFKGGGFFGGGFFGIILILLLFFFLLGEDRFF